VYLHVLYGVEVYANTGDVHLQKLITLNNRPKLLRTAQSKSYNYPVKDLYLKFTTLPVPELHIHQLLKLTHKLVHHQYLLPKTFASYFTINNTVHSHNTRINENFHLASVSTNLGKRRVQYKASKIWNQLLTSLKRLCTRNVIPNQTRGQSNLTKSALRGAHSPVRGHPRGSKVVPLNSWGRVSY